MKRIAVLGAGMIADYHLGGLAGVAGAVVRVVTSRSRDKAEAVARRFGVVEASDDLTATLARADIDAVVITTPDDTHEEIAVAAARAGKAILLQKPMAISTGSARRIQEAATAAGVDLQVSFMHRWFEEVGAARELIAAGAIGRVTSVRMRNATPGPDWGDWFFDPARVPGGVLLQLGVHGIDLVTHLFGPVEAVAGRTAILMPSRRLADGREASVANPDNAWATYRLAGGIVACHEMSMTEAAGTERFRMEIYGTDGTIWLRSERGRLAIARKGAGGITWETPELAAAPLGRRHHQRWIDGLTGAAPPERTAEDALHGLAVAEAIMRSADAGGREIPVA